jgi:SdrD B-like domain
MISTFKKYLPIWMLFVHSALSAQCILMTNPSFESGMTDWNWTGSAAGISILSGGAYAGTQYMQVNAGYTAGAYTTITGVVAGQQYKLEAYFRSALAGTPGSFGIEWLNSSNVVIQTRTASVGAGLTTWTNHLKYVTAPVGAVSARILVWKNGIAGTMDVDGFCFQIAPPDCDINFATTNATNPYTADGKISIISNFAQNVDIGITLATGGPTHTILYNSTAGNYYTGLAPGNYVINYIMYGYSYTIICQGTKNVTVGANAIPACPGTTIGGYVYGDYNQSGGLDTKERGLSTVNVQAYNAAGTLASTATSNSLGFYQLTGLTAGQPYRLEFAWPDGHIKPGAIGASQASVQFVNAGTCTANLGLNYPSDYCHTNDPYLTMSCFVNGNTAAPAVAPLDAMVAYHVLNTTKDLSSTAYTPPIHVSTAGQLGSVWAQAYQKSTKYVYTSAALRRYMSFGPLGTGGIYKIDMTNPASPTTTPWVDLNTIGIPTGTDPRNGTPANILATSPGTPAYDANAYNLIGKMAIGGMDFSDYGDTLWLVNLNDRKLYGIVNVAPGVTPTAAQVRGGYPITLPSGYSCPTNPNDFRPWAVKYYKGKVYVGAVCSGESGAQSNTTVTGFVLSFDPTNPGAGFSHVINFPLGYTRYGYNSSLMTFDSWVDYAANWYYAPQPILTDLEFDINSDLIIGFGDRGGLQSGYQNYPPDPTATANFFIDGNSHGEIVRACATTTGYIKEGNLGCPFPPIANPANPNPNTEFYWGEHGPFTNDFSAFQESSMGALAQIPIAGVVVTSVQDPTIWHAGGTIALNNTVGGDLYRFSVYDQYSPGGAGKSSGLGDIEPLCDYAPIEIGERVFNDVDNDGRQDAGEAGITGVVVNLYRTSDNALIGTATTIAGGIYKFTGLTPNTAYYILINTSQTALSGLNTSTANVGTNDLIDSDGVVSGVNVRVDLTTSTPGNNNHSYDFGFNGCPAITVNLGSNQTICTGGSVTLTPSATGGTPGYTYAWDNGLGAGPSQVVSPLSTITYNVTATDALGCTGTTQVTITVVSDPIVSITSNTTAVCTGGSAVLTATPVGGTGTCTLQWQNNTGSGWNNISGATANTFSPTGLTANADYRVVYLCSAPGCCN